MRSRPVCSLCQQSGDEPAASKRELTDEAAFLSALYLNDVSVTRRCMERECSETYLARNASPSPGMVCGRKNEPSDRRACSSLDSLPTLNAAHSLSKSYVQ